MSADHKPSAGNAGGRPAGRTTINALAIRRAYNRSVAPHADELLQRAVERALGGDNVALAAVVGVIGEAMRLPTGAWSQG